MADIAAFSFYLFIYLFIYLCIYFMSDLCIAEWETEVILSQLGGGSVSSIKLYKLSS